MTKLKQKIKLGSHKQRFWTWQVKQGINYIFNLALATQHTELIWSLLLLQMEIHLRYCNIHWMVRTHNWDPFPLYPIWPISIHCPVKWWLECILMTPLHKLTNQRLCKKQVTLHLNMATGRGFFFLNFDEKLKHKDDQFMNRFLLLYVHQNSMGLSQDSAKWIWSKSLVDNFPVISLNFNTKHN